MRATPHGERPLSVEEFEKQTGRQAKDRLVDLQLSNGVAGDSGSGPKQYND